jgi:hypothetical protein
MSNRDTGTEVPEALWSAAADLRYLLNHGYSKDASLRLVGNRYALTYRLRHILQRGVFADHQARLRYQKKVVIEEVRDSNLMLDGHNVLITVETALSQHATLQADDGFIRDISEVSHKYRPNTLTHCAIELIVHTIHAAAPSAVHVLFDSPMSGSGELAARVTACLREAGILGDARAVKVPERIMKDFEGVVASSDTAVIDAATRVFDLAGYIVLTMTDTSPIRLRDMAVYTSVDHTD